MGEGEWWGPGPWIPRALFFLCDGTKLFGVSRRGHDGEPKLQVLPKPHRHIHLTPPLANAYPDPQEPARTCRNSHESLGTRRHPKAEAPVGTPSTPSHRLPRPAGTRPDPQAPARNPRDPQAPYRSSAPIHQHDTLTTTHGKPTKQAPPPRSSTLSARQPIHATVRRLPHVIHTVLPTHYIQVSPSYTLYPLYPIHPETHNYGTEQHTTMSQLSVDLRNNPHKYMCTLFVARCRSA